MMNLGMAKMRKNKKYRHGIKAGKKPKIKVKKSDILRKIEALEELILARLPLSLDPVTSKNNQ